MFETTAANPSRKNRPSSSGRLVMYVGTLLAAPAGALGYSGALAAALSKAVNAYESPYGEGDEDEDEDALIAYRER